MILLDERENLVTWYKLMSAICCKLDSKSLYYHTVLAFLLTCCHRSPLQPTTAGDN